MTKSEAIAELVRIWNSPHLDLSLKAGLAEAIDALKGEPDFWDEDDYWAMTKRKGSETLNGVDGDLFAETPTVSEKHQLSEETPTNAPTDLISRQDAIDVWDKLSKRGRTEFDQVLMTLPSAEPKTGRDCTDFIRWLMDEVMDEENWQMNAVVDGEIICRKLKKLGLLDVVDGYYVETQKTGEWVRHELWDMPWYTCSECDFHGRNDYKFCPNCGSFNGSEEE